MAKGESAVAVEIVQAETLGTAASRACDVAPLEIGRGVGVARRRMENTLTTTPIDMRQDDEKPPKDLHAACGEAMRGAEGRRSASPSWRGMRP
ncbi:MAG: DUF1153 domain-containing protein [Pseudomonadota bacterium]